jgi:hypothetical protein
MAEHERISAAARGNTPATTSMEKRMTATGAKFYCNMKALNSAERARHEQLTHKLIVTARR